MHPGIQSWKNLLKYSWNAFSSPLLLRTLFSPWQMDTGEGSHFDILAKIVFAIFSRVLGFVARMFFITLGLLFSVLVIFSFPFFFFVPLKISMEFLENLGSFGAELSYGSTFTLNKHAKDLHAEKDLRMYGKEKTLRMIERGLSKDTNHNVLLVGATGVGKETIANHLGRLGRSGLTFPGILHKRVLELNLEDLKLDDFDKCLKEARRAGNVILVIKNIHGYPNLYERLAPYLDDPHLGIIGTTDFAGHDQVLKAHPEFLSKFEKVEVPETSFEDTVLVLKNHALLNRTKIEPDALLEIVRLAGRYIGNQAEPLRSILVLEELRALKRKIQIDDVRQIISDKTNIPIGALDIDERQVLLSLEKIMREKVVGQDEAVKEVSEALRRMRAGVADPTKPAGSFLFLGPTGVGKTYTAKILAESYFGRKDAMVRFDMSEFALPESVNVFADRLASVIEEYPLSLVFFDELEKSHRDIHHLLLQVLDEGRLTRENGRVANFKESIIIATSNAGAIEIIKNPDIEKKTLLDVLIKNGMFAPEFLNRFSGIVVFKPLNEAQVKSVAELMLRELALRIKQDKNITLEITPELVDKIASAGFDPDFGARPIKRAIEEIVENKIADYIIEGKGEGIIKII